jgi:transposase-like protein
VGQDGHGKVLDVSISMSEKEVHWRTFMESLVKRGLRGGKLIISDDHLNVGMGRQ